jgi:antitoxin VapB
VERVGSTLVLRLVAHETLADIGKIFSMFSLNFMAEGREFQEEHERDWGDISPLPAKARG